ncbi:SRPBCC domain-containing protein [Solitalea sp. MAHUQ-68]|uniref:SRPBCC domain-containing protein n=1 Tax=Solitalea agri TaxID=2953739 RepID=A0A9X2JDL1_9SPHI|nr:SRPBCC domain-containing protein [Solitalea agri]MCO4293035.1 SRPBCC domain-containing protein [Solitalea agri]
MNLDNSACAEAQMMIRKPVSQVFQSMIDPAITTNFWFTKSSGKLVANQKVTWTWEMYNFSTEAEIIEIIENEKIVFNWGKEPRTVEFTFKSLSEHSTYVVVKEYGYTETGDNLLSAIKDSTGGFTTVLDGMKAFLEHGINLNLIADKFPQGIN